MFEMVIELLVDVTKVGREGANGFAAATISVNLDQAPDPTTLRALYLIK